jgi:hypothetical protein
MVSQGTKKYLKPTSTTKAKVVTPYIVFAFDTGAGAKPRDFDAIRSLTCAKRIPILRMTF